jgi:hypothetical protein
MSMDRGSEKSGKYDPLSYLRHCAGIWLEGLRKTTDHMMTISHEKPFAMK